MKELIQTLLEDYQRRLVTATNMKNDLSSEGFDERILAEQSRKKYYRLETKASCYRTFISELQSILDKEQVKTDY